MHIIHNTNSNCHGFIVGNNQSTQGRGPQARVDCDHIIPLQPMWNILYPT